MAWRQLVLDTDEYVAETLFTDKRTLNFTHTMSVLAMVLVFSQSQLAPIISSYCTVVTIGLQERSTPALATPRRLAQKRHRDQSWGGSKDERRTLELPRCGLHVKESPASLPSLRHHRVHHRAWTAYQHLRNMERDSRSYLRVSAIDARPRHHPKAIGSGTSLYIL